MSANITVIKRDHRQEPYNHEKMQTSIYRSCRGVDSPIEVAEEIVKVLSKEVLNWLTDKSEITTKDLRQVINSHMRQYHPDAAALYAYSGTI